MATFLVCPIDGVLPADNGSDTSKANNVVPTASDAVQTASGVIGSASGTTVIVVTGSNFAVGQFITVPSRGPERMKITGISTNTLTVTRSALGEAPLATIALNDIVLTGLDANGQPPHCPICGSAVNAYDSSKVTTLTGVAAGSQHPADLDAVYVTSGHNPEAQFGATAYPLVSGQRSSVFPHTFAKTSGNVTRGDKTVTPSTVNTVAGP